jgi:hypothetical protein
MLLLITGRGVAQREINLAGASSGEAFPIAATAKHLQYSDPPLWHQIMVPGTIFFLTFSAWRPELADTFLQVSTIPAALGLR